MTAAPGFPALQSGRASAAHGPSAGVDPSVAGFRALALQVRAMGLLDRRPGYYRVKITLAVFAFFAGWVLLVIVGNSWAALAVAPLAGVMFTQLGFIGHDAGHNQAFGTRRRNRLLGLMVGNALIGLSFGWWVPKHNAHHAHPNEMGRDPDIGEGSALPAADAPGEGPGPVASWLARWQAPLFFPLMLLRSSGMHVLGIQRLARRRDRAAAVEACLIVLHAASYLAVVLWVLFPLRALAFVVVQQGVFSVYLASASRPTTRGCRSSRPERRPASPAARWSRSGISAAGRSPPSCSAALTTRSSTTCSRRCPGPTCDESRAWSGTSAQTPASATAKKASPGHSGRLFIT
jgi:hypothetical protein